MKVNYSKGVVDRNVNQMAYGLFTLKPVSLVNL